MFKSMFALRGHSRPCGQTSVMSHFSSPSPQRSCTFHFAFRAVSPLVSLVQNTRTSFPPHPLNASANTYTLSPSQNKQTTHQLCSAARAHSSKSKWGKDSKHISINIHPSHNLLTWNTAVAIIREGLQGMNACVHACQPERRILLRADRIAGSQSKQRGSHTDTV